MRDIITTLYFGNSLAAWARMLAIVAISFVVAKGLYWACKRWLVRFTAKTQTQFDDILIDMLEEPLVVTVILIGVRYALSTLSISERISQSIDHIFLFAIAIVIAWFITRFYDAIHLHYFAPWAARTETDFDDQILPMMRNALKFMIYGLAIILGLNNAGYNLGTVLAGLGIGGLAFALAAQDTVANVFGGITVLLQRPFATRDRIQVGGFEGYVAQVGLRTSKLEMITGEEIFLPNKVLVSEPIVNMERARVYPESEIFHLHRDTTTQQLEIIFDLISELGEAHEHVRRARGLLDKVSEYSIDIKLLIAIAPWRPGQPFPNYRNKISMVKSQMLMATLKAFEEHQIKLALPIHVIKSLPGEADGGVHHA